MHSAWKECRVTLVRAGKRAVLANLFEQSCSTRARASSTQSELRLPGHRDTSRSHHHCSRSQLSYQDPRNYSNGFRTTGGSSAAHPHFPHAKNPGSGRTANTFIPVCFEHIRAFPLELLLRDPSVVFLSKVSKLHQVPLAQFRVASARCLLLVS